MKVGEVRNEISKYERKELENIIIELYKRIPKSKKEEYDIDDFIKNASIKVKGKVKKVNFIELVDEVEQFLTDVDKEYYAVPNKIVSKKERSTWRFKVKRFYKELNNYNSSNDEGLTATYLLINLFKRLSIGSNRLLFTNFETFRAVGVSQCIFYSELVSRILLSGRSKENFIKCISLLDVPRDPYDFDYEMFEVLLENLENNQEKLWGVEIFKDKINDVDLKLKNTKNNSSTIYYLENDRENFVMAIFDIYITLGKVQEGINYFRKECMESKERKEYELLDNLEKHNLFKEWINEYELNAKKFDFDESLKNKYNEFKKITINE